MVILERHLARQTCIVAMSFWAILTIVTPPHHTYIGIFFQEPPSPRKVMMPLHLGTQLPTLQTAVRCSGLRQSLFPYRHEIAPKVCLFSGNFQLISIKVLLRCKISIILNVIYYKYVHKTIQRWKGSREGGVWSRGKHPSQSVDSHFLRGNNLSNCIRNRRICLYRHHVYLYFCLLTLTFIFNNIFTFNSLNLM